MIKTSIATVSISGDLSEKLRAIAAAGFDAVEIFENDFLTQDRGPREVGALVRDHGLDISLFQPFRDFEGMPEPHRRRAFDRAERKFDVMQELGADLMLICSNISDVALGGIDRAADDLAELGERAEKRGVWVGYEALAWGRFVNDHRDAWEIVRRADHAHIGIILDSFHSLARKIDTASIRAIPADKIFLVQLADAPAIEMDLFYWSRHFRNMPGEGDLPVTEFVRAVMATGYDGTLSLEIFNDQFRGGSAKSISIDGHRSLVHVLDQVRRAEPFLAVDLPEMPDRIAVRGYEFVEFTAQGTELDQLCSMLRTLGFRPTGQHLFKNVTLWKQGEINLVINSEAQGFARSAYLVHGTSVCDIGLNVADAKATLERARALGAEVFTQAAGSGELTIPAIHGAGGGVLHFVDDGSELSRVWDTEFRSIEDSASTVDAGLTRIDHVAQSMNFEEMLTWLLFHTSIFETEKTPLVDVIDPGGLIRSQAIENDDGSFRMTLNGVDNRRTFAGRFVAESFGSAVQHLAFATDNIFDTAAALHENGFKPLEISRNYYDDMEARLGLDPAFSDRLRANNILYDRDGQSDYFQLYSPVYADGFFFEVVQRNGGYDGYGAPNAPFRIAAQRRAMPPKGMPSY